jgi:MFS family permease
MAESARTRITYSYELWRAVASGILETASSTFLLTIAVRQLQAGPLAKAVVAAAGSFGLLASPIVVTMVTSARWAPSQAAARVLAIGATSFLLATLLPGLLTFVVCSVIAMASSAAIIPLLTHMYQENYPEHDRGRRFSRTVMIRIATAVVFAKVAGDALTGHLHRYPWLLLVFGMALGFAAFCLARCPTDPILPDGGEHPLRALRFVRDDKLFRRTLICWMMMGFANLMMLPLRVEYLANAKYGLQLSVGMIALLTGVIPNAARLILSPVWGHLFDRVNFFALRVTLNVGFAVGILSFFATESLAGLIFGAIVFGVSSAGGDVAWSLWVTKFAPPGRVADYMAAHTFLTGVRGVLAPITAFYAVNQLAPNTLATIATGLILVATALLIPEIKFGRKAPRTSALVEEVSD